MQTIPCAGLIPAGLGNKIGRLQNTLKHSPMRDGLPLMITTESNILTPSKAVTTALPPSISFEELIAKLPARERGAVQRHEAACEELDPSHAD